jgi:hypothetical protein
VSALPAAAPQRIPRRTAPARPEPGRDERRAHLRLVDTERRRRERRRGFLVRLWAVGIVLAALVGVTVHAFMAEAQVHADRLDATIRREEARYDDARLALAHGEAPAVVTARARRLGLVPGAQTRTLPVPGVEPGAARAPEDATADAQAVKRAMDGTP